MAGLEFMPPQRTMPTVHMGTADFRQLLSSAKSPERPYFSFNAYAIR
ncbi:hypothetical protein IMCC20628_04864 (plasmid) [Hoeflea sp. IMCC20628]|nr:hypothetical protein IMCC20628_04864 [Hoeflea sp. IMCC20628]